MRALESVSKPSLPTIVMASFLWHAAERADPLPRMPLATKPAETNPFAYEEDDD